MSKKYITEAGKQRLLELAFTDNQKPFQYMALGNGNGAISEDKNNFNEISGNNYQRVNTIAIADETGITISGTFEGNNFNPADGGNITEIALYDSESHKDNETCFAIIEVPEIVKTNNISLKYTVVISLI